MKLRCVHPARVPVEFGVDARVSLAGTLLVAEFDVRSGPIHANPAFSQSDSVWGLWDFDVVELFIRTSSGSTYFEFQVSPEGQGFELEVLEPRKQVNREFRSGFQREARRLSPDSWSARIEIDLANLSWDGNPRSLQGNLFAILGEGTERTYWSAFLPEQKVPDFHLPQYFRALIP
ncbi:MAG: hypothetical protein ACXWPM_02370 [Bdellovibrionota bacterium]